MALSPQPSARDFSQVAKIIRGRTTDLIAIAIVAIFLLSFGDELTRWWRVDPDEAASPLDFARSELPVETGWGLDGQPVNIEFGGGRYSLQRQLLGADEKDVGRVLLRELRRYAAATLPPPFEPDDAERRLLAKASTAELVEEDRDAGWWIYRVSQGREQYVAVRRFAGKPGTHSSKEDTANGLRIVSWGMAVPSAAEEILLYIFYPTVGESLTLAEGAKFDLPPGSRQVMSLRTESGGALVTFSGEGSRQEWFRFFDDWFTKREGERTSDWKEASGGWFAGYRLPTESGRARVDVVIHEEGEGRLGGTLNIVLQPVGTQATH